MELGLGFSVIFCISWCQKEAPINARSGGRIMTTNTDISRRALLGVTGAALAAPGLALAQGRFPDRPIQLVVPWPAGGSADAQLRSISELVGKALGQPMVVQNRPGAGGTLGVLTVAQQARPDGYTLTQMHLSVLRRPWMMRTPGWDFPEDLGSFRAEGADHRLWAHRWARRAALRCLRDGGAGA
jgi:hypothetical protein